MEIQKNKALRRKQWGIRSALQSAGFQTAFVPRDGELNPEEIKKSDEPGVKRIKLQWLEMTLFERFEYVVMLIVSFLLVVIILIALYRLMLNVYQLTVSEVMDEIHFKAFQETFGMLLTLLIAFEFRNSINAILEGRGLLIQVKIVVLIAIIALARKFLVLDTTEYDPAMVAALAGVALSLGVVYWILSKRELEDKDLVSRI